MSAIGNFEERGPSRAMLEAYGQLFAWKLSLHGVDASSTKQWVTDRSFPAINGHRDAALDRLPGQVPLRQARHDPVPWPPRSRRASEVASSSRDLAASHRTPT